VGIKGQPLLIDDELIGTVKTDDSLWEIDSVDGKRYDPAHSSPTSLASTQRGGWLTVRCVTGAWW